MRTWRISVIIGIVGILVMLVVGIFFCDTRNTIAGHLYNTYFIEETTLQAEPPPIYKKDS